MNDVANLPFTGFPPMNHAPLFSLELAVIIDAMLEENVKLCGGRKSNLTYLYILICLEFASYLNGALKQLA